jgi:hypothetical protein
MATAMVQDCRGQYSADEQATDLRIPALISGLALLSKKIAPLLTRSTRFYKKSCVEILAME